MHIYQNPLRFEPKPKFNRWTASRKLEVVRQVNEGELLAAEACNKYGLSPEELQSWMDAATRNDPSGSPLRVRSMLAARSKKAA